MGRRRRGGHRRPVAPRRTTACPAATTGSSPWVAPISWWPTGASPARPCGPGSRSSPGPTSTPPRWPLAVGPGPAGAGGPPRRAAPGLGLRRRRRGAGRPAEPTARWRGPDAGSRTAPVHAGHPPSHSTTSVHRALRCAGPAGEWKGVAVAQSFSKARFLTVQEVADLMRVSSMTVYRLIKAGDLPAVRVGPVVPGERRPTSTPIWRRGTRRPADARQRGRTAPTRPFVAFLSDYGHADEFVGVCKGVIASIAPEARVVDLVHDLPPHDVAAGGARPAAVGPVPPRGGAGARRGRPGRGHRPPPGRGRVRRRRPSSVPTTGCSPRRWRCSAGRAGWSSSTDDRYHLPAPGPTFAGRDVLAAALGAPRRRECRSRTSAPRSTPSAWCPAWSGCPGSCRVGRSRPRCGGSTASATASSTSVPTSSRSSAASADGRVEVRAGDVVRAARWVHTYADAKSSELVLVVDSYGLLALALDRRSAAAELGLRTGAPVTLVPAGGADLTDARARTVAVRRRGAPVRQGTTIAIVALLVLILAAAFAQFVLRLGSLTHPRESREPMIRARGRTFTTARHHLVRDLGTAPLVGPHEVGHDPQHPLHQRAGPEPDPGQLAHHGGVADGPDERPGHLVVEPVDLLESLRVALERPPSPVRRAWSSTSAAIRPGLVGQRDALAVERVDRAERRRRR